MSEALIRFAELVFVGPLWPASIMVGVMLVYAIFAMIGLLDFDFGVDLDTDADADLDVDLDGPVDVDGLADGATFGGIGAVTLRWLNLGRIPLIIWFSIFTSLFWTISYALWYENDAFHYEPTLLPSALLIIRNAVIATAITKVITDQLSKLYRPGPTFEAGKLIGRTCTVSTGEVTATFGQAKFATDAAPLLLNIRTDGETLPKGTLVEIIAFDSDRRIYQVAAASDKEQECLPN